MKDVFALCGLPLATDPACEPLRETIDGVVAVGIEHDVFVVEAPFVQHHNCVMNREEFGTLVGLGISVRKTTGAREMASLREPHRIASLRTRAAIA
jgi:hypothetical protein